MVDVQQRGAIQNIGIHPAHRDQGLAAHALKSYFYQSTWFATCELEVTSQNIGALGAKRLGFHIIKTVYKPAPTITY